MADRASDRRPFFLRLGRYQRTVFLLALLGWLFDTMDVQIFVASKVMTMRDLLPDADEALRTTYTGYVVALFILGWATGGIVFSVLGDRWGRARTMALTILVYAVFTGLCGLATTWWQFGACRFLTGLGLGGEFAAGAALVAEVVPNELRAAALGALQALTVLGNILGVCLFWVITPRWGWQWLYFVGAFPAVLAVVVRLGLKEPATWLAARAAAVADPGSSVAPRLGRLRELFTVPELRRRTLVGTCLAASGVIVLWGVGFWTPELLESVVPAMSIDERAALTSKALIMQQIGAFFGMWVFGALATRLGRRAAFLATFLIGWTSVLVTFYTFHDVAQIWYLWPLIGFGTLAPFAGYAIYFPELFPTRLRASGTGFCYNAGRYIAMLGPLTLGHLGAWFQGWAGISGFRVAAMVVACAYWVGIAALLWAPETRGRPLPDDERVWQ